MASIQSYNWKPPGKRYEFKTPGYKEHFHGSRTISKSAHGHLDVRFYDLYNHLGTRIHTLCNNDDLSKVVFIKIVR